ncbi:hypothetical protein EV368DRAFT_86391 [Lentinula lateritia]|nr:hypothetical protein EV368DRAFT_86391 [Lentinula lateritia]
MEVVVLKDLLDRLNIQVPDLENMDVDEGLSLYEFQLASKNYFAFELSRDPDGQDGTRTNWTRQHFLFFNNQRDAEKYYRFWKPREYRLREEHHLYNTKFDLNTYNMAWNHIVTDYERSLEAKPRQAQNHAPNFTPSGSKPFSEGNKGDSFDLCCLGCGGLKGEKTLFSDYLKEKTSTFATSGISEETVNQTRAVRTRMFVPSVEVTGITPSLTPATPDLTDIFLKLSVKTRDCKSRVSDGYSRIDESKWLY